MTKQEENTTGKKGKTTASSKGKKAAGKEKAPERSGEVKGPMGVGGKKKPETTARVKKAAKGSQSAQGRFAAKEEDPAGSKKNSPKKKLPEQTSQSEEHLVTGDLRQTRLPRTHVAKAEEGTGETTGKVKKPSGTGASAKSGKTEAAKARGTGETPEKKPAKKKAPAKGSEADKKEKSPAKKMTRRRPTKGISAEEKMKLPNTSTREELSDTAKKTARELADKVLPDKKTREEMGEIARSMLPDQDKVVKTAGKVANSLTPDPEDVAKLADKIIPDQDLKEKVKKKAASAKKTAKDVVSAKEKEPSTAEKPAEATLLSDYDVHLFREGKHYHLYKKMGSHLMDYMGTKGVYFALWAPNARVVSVIGDFNGWDRQAHFMEVRQDASGIWEVFIPEAKNGSLYKYFIQGANGYEVEKGDPFAFCWETPPETASMVWDLTTTWEDTSWMENRRKKAGEAKPISVYELHIGSWKRVPEEDLRFLTYRELAEQLPEYLREMEFTHVEFMPVMEHPFFGSWGYQITGYFAPSSRFGSPQDFMHLIDALHQADIGVILDWVPSHFPHDQQGLHYFDGTFLYEHADPQKGFHPDWQSYIFNYGRNEVRSFLISNALYWMDLYHVDGLRVDAVASMLYLDYSRKDGEWEPNEFGGRENLEAISFLKEFNEVVYGQYPDAITIAEESTAWPMVSKPTYIGGLGFGMKWMMGWMHDTLDYFQKDPVHRKHHQNTITFSTTYAFTENFMLPLSHDEVVYGKQSIWNKMPGDSWNKFANLRSLYAYMFAHPGGKLLFMGSEFGQTTEWDHDSSLQWHLTDQDSHRQVQETLKVLNRLYKSEPALYELGFDQAGFEWIDINDADNSIISFMRKGHHREDDLMVICNFTPVPRENYRLGLSRQGRWKEVFNSDDDRFGGSGVGNKEAVGVTNVPTHGKDHSVAVSLPPMGVIFLKQVE